MLSETALRNRLRDRDSGLAVTPILSSEQISGASVDLRLGPDLITTRRETGVLAFDPGHVEQMQERLREYQTYVRRPLGAAFHLHPGDFAIARSLEYVTIPSDLSAQAIGRSSWGRLGLVIATATLIQPDFRGTITLELANVGTVPLVLYVGVRIAQISFYPTPVEDDLGALGSSSADGRSDEAPAGGPLARLYSKLHDRRARRRIAR